MRAIVLTESSRQLLRPLSFSEAPAMASIVGAPLLEIWIRKLVRAGFDEIVLATGRFGDSIEAFLGDGRRFGARIAYSFQGRVRGGVLEPYETDTAATVRRIHSQTGFCSQTTLLLRPVGLANLDLTAMLKQHRAQGVAQTTARFDGSSPGTSPHVALFEAEVATLAPEAHQSADGSKPAQRASSVRLRQGEFLAGSAFALGSIGDYLDACMAALRGELDDWTQPGVEIVPGVRLGVNVSVDLSGVELTGPIYLGGGSVIRPGARIQGPAWIGGCAVVDSGATVRRSVVGPYSRVSSDAVLDGCLVSGDRVVNRRGETTLLEPVGPAWPVEERREPQRDGDVGESMTLELRKLAGRAAGLWPS